MNAREKPDSEANGKQGNLGGQTGVHKRKKGTPRKVTGKSSQNGRGGNVLGQTLRKKAQLNRDGAERKRHTWSESFSDEA